MKHIKLKELKELLDGYSGDAEVQIVDLGDPHINKSIVGVNVEDWGKTLEILIAKGKAND